MKTLAESELFNVCGGGGVQVVPFVYYQEDIDKLGAVPPSAPCDLAMPYYSFGPC